MSRIGKLPVEIPSNVEVSITDDVITIKGAKGELTVPHLSHVTVKQEGTTLTVEPVDQSIPARSEWGLSRTLIANAVEGLTDGFTKELEVQGVGFKVDVSGQKITLALGFSHPVIYTAPPEVAISVEGMIITLKSHDKQLLGQTAAEIREFKKPEPYKGKGIRYVGEYVRRKAGKAAVK